MGLTWAWCRGLSSCHAELELGRDNYHFSFTFPIKHRYKLTRGSRAQNIISHSRWGKYPVLTTIVLQYTVNGIIFASPSPLKKVSWIAPLRVYLSPQISFKHFNACLRLYFLLQIAIWPRGSQTSETLSNSKFTHCSIFVLYLKFISRVEQFLFSLMALSQIID